MNDLNLENDPYFNHFIALLNSVRKNDRVGVQAAVPYVEKMEKSAAAFGLALLNTPSDVEIGIVEKISPLAVKVNNNSSYFNVANYLVSRAAVRFAEHNNVEALKHFLPHLAQFKSRNDLDVEEDLYLDIAVEKQYPELLSFVVRRQIENGNFGGLGMVQTALFARKNNDFWGIEALQNISQEMNFKPEDWGLVALALQQEGAQEWAQKVIDMYAGEAGFDSTVNHDHGQVSPQAFKDVKTLVENYRVKQELQKIQDEVQAQARGDKKP